MLIRLIKSFNQPTKPMFLNNINHDYSFFSKIVYNYWVEIFYWLKLTMPIICKFHFSLFFKVFDDLKSCIKVSVKIKEVAIPIIATVRKTIPS